MSQLKIASCLSIADGKWQFTGEFAITGPKGSDALVDILMLVKPLLAENDSAAPVDEHRAGEK